MNSTPDDPQERPDQPADERLIAAHDLARAALLEITPEATIGDPAGYSLEEDGVVSLLFQNRLAGYPGWYWTVSVARVDDAEPTVLEAELMPGEHALLAPDWVPWAMRLAEYQAAQAALAEANAAAGIVEEIDLGDGTDDLDDEDDLDADALADLDDLDAADFDTDGSPILHAGDVDGVDIDELSDAFDGSDDEDDSDEDDSDEDDSDGDESDDDDDEDSSDEDDDLDSDEEEDDFEESDEDEDDLDKGSREY
jgi:hypothetical protein